MPEPAKTVATPSKPKPGSDLPFEAQLWKAADTLRNNMDSAEYKHVVLPELVHSCHSTHLEVDLPGVIVALSDRLGH